MSGFRILAGGLIIAPSGIPVCQVRVDSLTPEDALIAANAIVAALETAWPANKEKMN